MAFIRILSTVLSTTFLCVIASTVHADGQKDARMPERVVIQGVDHYRVLEPLFEGVRIALAHRGESYSPGYIQGIAGSAFRIAGICPCAPTVSRAMDVVDLIRLLGYDYELLPIDGEGVEPAARLREVLPRVKQEIREGSPVLLWSPFTTCEWDVVCGFDEAKGKLIGRGSYKGTADDYAEGDETALLRVEKQCGLGPAILIGDKTGGFDASAAELSALREAVRIGRSRKNEDSLDGEHWEMLEGLMCYDRWIADWGKPDKERASADVYCLGIYRSSRRAGAGFLREIAPRYPEATDRLTQAAGHFEAEAAALDRCDAVFGWKSPKGPDSKRNEQAAALLAEARDHYAAGITKLEAALDAIDQ